MKNKDKDFLLKAYGDMYNSECGPWNVSLASKWLEYEITKFFEENFKLLNQKYILNIGIGAGYWDRFLTYNMPKRCTLVSIDKDIDCCKQLNLCLINEENPNSIEIINDDVMNYNNLNKFDIITMIGSTRCESGLYKEIINKVLSMLMVGGSLFYSSIDKNENKSDLLIAIDQHKYLIDKYEIIENCNIKLILAKITLK